MQTTMPRNQSITEEQIQMIKNALESIQSGKRAEKERAGQIEKSRNALLARDLEARKAREAEYVDFEVINANEKEEQE